MAEGSRELTFAAILALMAVYMVMASQFESLRDPFILLSLEKAVMQGGRNRLRPTLMTASTTVLGLLPMSLGIGEGGEVQAPLARVVIGGLVTSTLITLVLIPVVYLLLEERTERVRVLAPAHEPAPGD